MKSKIYKLLLFTFFISISIFSQQRKSTETGYATIDELKMKFYDKDSTATAVVLYERANYYIDVDHNYDFRTDFYYRIKILDKSAFKKATINLNTYKKEIIENIDAKTYNLRENGTMEIVNIANSDIFEKDLNQNYTQKSFTFPNVREGSIIEYTYSLFSPYTNIDDWEFQSDIPKVKSEIDIAILGNYKYNIRIVGFQKLDKDESDIKRYCVDIPGPVEAGACALLFYGMNNIPAFVEEDYMTSKNNFASKLVFDLKSYTNTRGVKTDYTETWKDAERTLRKNFLDKQTSKKGFFRRNLPENILENTDELSKAKNIYNFI